MADTNNHYERAFSAYLRQLRVPAIWVDESRRTFCDDESTKSLDFVVNVAAGRWLLIDVKGRKLPGRRRFLENWATEDDIVGLARWQDHFGSDCLALLVFVYEVDDESRRQEFAANFTSEGRHYGCQGISVADYRAQMRRRSARWQTVSLPQDSFTRAARPFTDWLGGHPFSRTSPPRPTEPASLKANF